MSYELAQKFAEYQLPAEIKSTYKAIGSLGFTKMMMFANEIQLTNDNIDYFMSFKATRTEDETPEQFRQRSKFAKALVKYRAHLYDYSVYY